MDIQVIEGTYRYRPEEGTWTDELLGLILLEGRCETLAGIELRELPQCSFAVINVKLLESLEMVGAKAVLFQLPFVGSVPGDDDVKVLDEISCQVIFSVFFENRRAWPHRRAALEFVWYQTWHPQSEFVPPEANHDDAEDLVEAAIVFMRTHFDEALTLDLLADTFGCEKNSLLHAFRKSDHASPMKVLAEIRIEQVRKLLETSQLTIAQIAGRVGYSSLSTFNHFFKRHTGMSPREYREKHQWLL